MLVYCEGKTEAAYFNILLDFHRPPLYVDVDVQGQKGQHITLIKYAEEHGVNLAFSAPQFESYLLQHFEQSGATDMDEVFERLTFYRNQNNGAGPYDDSTKSDLDWMATAIDRKPKIVNTAVINSELREKTSKRPFLTVHNLTRRIIEMSI